MFWIAYSRKSKQVDDFKNSDTAKRKTDQQENCKFHIIDES